MQGNVGKLSDVQQIQHNKGKQSDVHQIQYNRGNKNQMFTKYSTTKVSNKLDVQQTRTRTLGVWNQMFTKYSTTKFKKIT